jgi:hypothetical protein
MTKKKERSRKIRYIRKRIKGLSIPEAATLLKIYSGEKYGSIVEYLHSLNYDYKDDKFIIKKGDFVLAVPYDEYENGVVKPIL